MTHSQAEETRAPATRLTLSDLMFSQPAKDTTQKIRPPPGLEFLESGNDEAKTLFADETPDNGSESDDASTGSGTQYRSSEAESSGLSDGESSQKQSSRLVLSDLVLSDVSVLKASSRSFVPMLDPSMAATLPSFTQQTQTPLQQTPLRAKLTSKAVAFVPTETPQRNPLSSAAEPFSGTGNVNAEGWDESWQQWSTEESYNYYDYGANEEYAEGYYADTYTEGFEGYSEQEGTSSWGSSTEFTPESISKVFNQI